MSSQTLAPKPEKAAKPKGWVRRLITYMAPHKKHAYIAFGVAIGGQLKPSSSTTSSRSTPVRSRRGSR